jgi:hypothetical protein
MMHDLFLAIEIVLVASLFFSCVFLMLLCILQQTRRAKQQGQQSCYPKAEFRSKSNKTIKKLSSGKNINLN